MKNNYKIDKFVWVVVVLSIFSLFILPSEELLTQVKKTLPWVATGVLASEILLTVGFITMLTIAAPAFVKHLTEGVKEAASTILHVKKKVSELDWGHVANKCNESRVFWMGFWLSIIGAAGDGIVIIAGIGKALPITSWGLMILPFWDLSLTYIIRRAIYKGVKR